MDKAQIERLTQLTLAAQGKATKRPLKDILRSEKSAAARYIPKQPVTKTPEGTSE
jgi:hypothetical protein